MLAFIVKLVVLLPPLIPPSSGTLLDLLPLLVTCPLVRLLPPLSAHFSSVVVDEWDIWQVRRDGHQV